MIFCGFRDSAEKSLELRHNATRRLIDRDLREKHSQFRRNVVGIELVGIWIKIHLNPTQNLGFKDY
jgi:hypothetical protein